MSAPARLCCATEVVVGTVLLGGCVLLPVPLPSGSDELMRSAQAKSIEKGESTSSINAKLGEPDLRSESGRVWIYIWEEKHGEWALFAIGPMADNFVHRNHLGALHSETYVLVLEFDAEGVLRSRDFAHSVSGSRERYCTDDQLCLDKRLGVVTVKGRAKERVQQIELQPSKCLLTVWLSKDGEQPSGDLSGLAPGVLLVNIDNTYPYRRVLAETFAAIPLPSGTHDIQVGSEKEPSTSDPVSIDCKPGDRVFFAVDVKANGASSTIGLRAVEGSAAESLTAKMPQQLLLW
jgi:hypothetical protein